MLFCSSGFLRPLIISNIVKHGLHVCCREEECEDAIKQEYLTDTDTLYVHPGQGGYHGAVFELPPEAGGGGVQLQQGEAQSVFETLLCFYLSLLSLSMRLERCSKTDLLMFPGEDPHHQQQQQQTSYTYTISCTGGQLQGGHPQYRHVQAHVPLDPLDTGGYVSQQQQHVAGPGPGYMEGARHTPPPPYTHGGPVYSSSFSPCSSSSSLSPPITVSTRYISKKFIHCCL